MFNEPKINEKIIDTHLHIEAWRNEEVGSFINGFEPYREGMELITRLSAYQTILIQ